MFGTIIKTVVKDERDFNPECWEAGEYLVAFLFSEIKDFVTHRKSSSQKSACLY